MNKLTSRQREVLNLVRSSIAENGLPPTRSEIAQALGFRSANAAEEHLRALAKKGAIEMLPGTSRGIRLLEDEEFDSDAELPVVGRVAAGQPILAQQHIDHFHRIDPGLFTPRAHYLLQVKGMSMRDAGILEGDLLAVHRTTEVNNGNIIVARLEDEVTVKRYYRKYNRVKLQAENPDYEPILINLKEQELNIEGIGVGIIRCGGPL